MIPVMISVISVYACVGISKDCLTWLIFFHNLLSQNCPGHFCKIVLLHHHLIIFNFQLQAQLGVPHSEIQVELN